VGHCKIDPHYFWYDIEPEEIDNIIKAYVDRYRDEWERTRLISYYAASGMSKLPTVRKFMPFAWDDEKEQKQHRPNQTKRNPSKEMMKLIADNNKIQK
jgi:type IV secretory pathway VirJ component